MRKTVFVAAAGVLAFGWFAHSSPAEARHVRHSHARGALVPYRAPYLELPPGYSRGGPMYTTCDRINRDRMLVGTCR